MKLEYILIPKNDDDKNRKTGRSFLKSCFDSIDNDTIILQMSNKIFHIGYAISKRNTADSKTNLIYLQIAIDEARRDTKAKVLSTVHQMMIDGGEKNAYYILLSNDEVSAYYAAKAYPYFHAFETQIRNLMYKLLTGAFGALWADSTVPENLKKIVKNKLNEEDETIRDERFIEQALNELDFGNLIDFLFKKTRDRSPVDVIDQSLSSEKLDELSKEEIIELIDEGRERTLWDKYCTPILDIDDMQSKMMVIKKLRNCIAHNKTFHIKDYNQAYSFFIREKLTERISSAADDIVSSASTEIAMSDVFASIGMLGEKYKSLGETLAKALYPQSLKLAEISSVVAQSMQGLNNSIADMTKQIQINIPKIDFSSFVPTDSITALGESMRSLAVSPAIADLAKQQNLISNMYTPIFDDSFRRIVESQSQWMKALNTSSFQSLRQAFKNIEIQGFPILDDDDEDE
jgi:hypothetical protein